MSPFCFRWIIEFLLGLYSSLIGFSSLLGPLPMIDDVFSSKNVNISMLLKETKFHHYQTHFFSRNSIEKNLFFYVTFLFTLKCIVSIVFWLNINHFVKKRKKKTFFFLLPNENKATRENVLLLHWCQC